MKRDLRPRVDRMCKECIHDPVTPGSWRVQVTMCTTFDCPLWEVRPITEAPISENTVLIHGLNPALFTKPKKYRNAKYLGGKKQ